MKNALNVLSLVALLGAGTVLAQSSKSAAPSKEQMEKAKSAMMKDREKMMGEVKAIDAQAASIMASVKGLEGEKAEALKAQVSKLQEQVKALEGALAKSPKYFDDPTANALRP